MKKNGFYIIKDEFFRDFPDPYLRGNKKENRPHYYCIEDKNGIYWMIPMSTRVEKYKKIIETKEKNKKKCDVLHILKLSNGKNNVFLIGDMFPITENYIEREYTIKNNHLMLYNESEIILIEKKAKKVKEMIKHGVKFTRTQPDVMKIFEKLVSLEKK